MSGAGAASLELVRLPELAIIRIVGLLGGSEQTAQRLFYTLLAALMAWAAVYFILGFVNHWVPAMVGGTMVVFNPFILQHAPNPIPMWAIAAMGFAAGLVLRGAHDGKGRVSLGVVAGLSGYLALNPPTLALVLLWTLTVALLASFLVGEGSTRRAIRCLIRSSLWAIALSAWWFVPLLVSLAWDPDTLMVGAQTNVREWAWTHTRNSLANVLTLSSHWAWTYPEYFPYAPELDRASWSPLRFALPVLALSAPLVTARSHRRAALTLGGLALGLVTLGKGLHQPLSELNLALYDSVPGMWLFREPMSKLGIALVILMAGLTSISLSGLSTAIRAKSWFRNGLLVVPVAAILAYPFPIWNGAVVPDERPLLPSAHVRIPAEWRALANRLNSLPVRGKVLILPLDDYYQVPTAWGYYGVDTIPRAMLEQPTIQLLPQTYFTDRPVFRELVRGVEATLIEARSDRLTPLLDALGVSHIILRHDLDSDFPGRRIMPSERLLGGLSGAPGLRLVESSSVASLYEYRGGQGRLVEVRDASAAGLLWWYRSPSSYRLSMPSTTVPITVVLKESFSEGWQLYGLPDDRRADHFIVDGYANAWTISPGPTFAAEIRYSPDTWNRIAQASSALAAGAAVIVFGVGRRRKPERRTLRATSHA